MASQASVVFATARTLLNDDAATLWTDPILLPKLVQAYRELESKLRINAAQIMKKTVNATIAINGLVYGTISDIKEPIKLWEKAVGGLDSSYVLMTEYDPLPHVAQAATLIYWQWDGTNINFIGSTAQRVVQVQYWRSLTEPTDNTSDLFFIDAEIYLAPRTAALAAGSVGEIEKFQAMTQIAAEGLELVIQANRGRQAPPATKRP